MPRRIPRELGYLLFKSFPGSVRGRVMPHEAWAIRSSATTCMVIAFLIARLIYGESHAATKAAAVTGLLVGAVVAVWGIIHYKTLSTPSLPPDDRDEPPFTPPFGPRPRA